MLQYTQVTDWMFVDFKTVEDALLASKSKSKSQNCRDGKTGRVPMRSRPWKERLWKKTSD